MKIACQNSLAGPGTLIEQFQCLKEWGFEGVEMAVWDRIEGCRSKKILTLEKEIQQAMEGSGLPVTSICGGIHFEFLDMDPAKRQADMERMKNALGLAGRLKAAGVVLVPIFHPHFQGVTPPPDLSPWKTSVGIQKELLVMELKELAIVAEKAGTHVILEPLNRYEAPWLNRLEQAMEICENVNSNAVGFMADLFHMNIEETDPDAALRKNQGRLKHVHLADNTRLQPGTGVINFKSSFAVLKEIGFKGAMALECGLLGEPSEALPKCARLLKKLRDEG